MNQYTTDELQAIHDEYIRLSTAHAKETQWQYPHKSAVKYLYSHGFNAWSLLRELNKRKHGSGNLSDAAIDELTFFCAYHPGYGMIRYGSNATALDELLDRGLIRVAMRHEIYGGVWYAPTIAGYETAQRLGYKVCPEKFWRPQEKATAA